MPELQIDSEGRIVYEIDGAVLKEFVLSDAPVQILMGPIGSAKSSTCALKLWKIACAQRPNPVDGIRRTRFAVCRTTYPELRTTTVRTWLEIFPERVYGRFVWSQPPNHTLRFADVEASVDFLALNDETDIAKLRSSEFTAVWFNELQYFPRSLFDEATSRVGRFPAVRDGGCTWSGVIADCNAPDGSHWLALTRGLAPLPEGLLSDERAALEWPPQWGWFQQPPGLLEVYEGDRLTGYDPNPAAENTRWLPAEYYWKLVAGKSRAWIKSRILNQVALVTDGDPVWPAFRRELHVAREPLRPVPGHPIYVAMDFGRSPAVIFAQSINNRISVLEEMSGFNTSAVLFAPLVKRRLEQHYRGFTFSAWGDPKGRDKTQSDENSAYDIFRSHGIEVRPAPVKMNLIETRIAAVDSVLSQLYDGRPRLQISPSCLTLISACEGGFCYERRRSSSELKTEPAKNRFSHLADALQYLCIAMGEGRTMMGLTPLSELKPMRIWHGHRTMRRVIS